MFFGKNKKEIYEVEIIKETDSYVEIRFNNEGRLVFKKDFGKIINGGVLANTKKEVKDILKSVGEGN